jgi:sulfite reductase beta subunit-like hemoprotein
VAETYGDGTARLTPEENILFVNVPDAQLPAMLAEPIFAKFKVNPGGWRWGGKCGCEWACRCSWFCKHPVVHGVLALSCLGDSCQGLMLHADT